MDWPCQIIQVVLFSSRPLGKPDALQLWQKTFKEGPAAFNSQAGMPGVSTAQDEVNGLQFVINAAVDRVDLIITAPAVASHDPEPPLIQNFDQAIAAAVNYGVALADGVRLSRLAIIGTFLKVCETREDANKELSEQLPDIGIVVDSWDAAFQMNIQKVDPEIGTINRFRRWNVGMLQLYQFQFGLGSAPLSQPLAAKFGATATIDVNTVPSEASITDAPATFAVLAAELKLLKSSNHANHFG